MARDKATQQNIDASDLYNYPNKRIRNNSGAGDGTPVDESVYGDIHETFAKFMRDSKIDYNNIPDNTTNGYQLYEAITSVGGKNDLVKPISKVSDNTLSIPIKINALKQDETILFKSNFDSTNLMQFIKGSDNQSKQLLILGGFKSGQIVRMINDLNYISLVGLYDSQIVPNLAQTLTNIQQTFINWTKIMSVFQVDGAMLFWNKPANTIPEGWQEVVDWRGRFPVGMNVDEPEFVNLGKKGGEKRHKLTINELPKHRFKIASPSNQSSYPSLNSGNSLATINNKGNDGNYVLGGVNDEPTVGLSSQVGEDQEHNNLPPYRTVLFIEYIG